MKITPKKALGWAMVATPFVAIFAAYALVHTVGIALTIFLSAGILAALIIGGVNLTT